MKYDFDTPVERRGTGCYKWDIIGKNELPMWVADMDFKTAPEIVDAMKSRLEHGVFGYNTLPDAWYDAYISWWKRRHNFEFSKEDLIFCTGVITALSSVIRKLSTPAEKILIQTPVYNHFMTSILNNGRNIITNELVYKDGKYSIDFDDLERKLADRQTTMMILCNPQNPTGNIWSKDELKKIGALCAKHNVVVLSDEIHCDVTTPGSDYTPFAS
ncbi:MAG: aminotransferase class I/II-fold pyridoxal phosphate-dependent enzyme, partial [Clostridia bacterium]|nr:aminotransferase class I/II-fold pyridoxal phosphate-dependent enzyme [Clostridia bacterium]